MPDHAPQKQAPQNQALQNQAPQIQVLPAPETYVTQTARVWCDGDEPGARKAGGDGHPRVWIQIGATGLADCGYCDRRFILAGGPADQR